MAQTKKSWGWRTAVGVALWILMAWLLYPLVNLDRLDMSNVLPTLYRSALGLTLMIIVLGKALFDLIFPWAHGRKLPVVNALVLALYALALTSGIVFMVIRMAMVYMKGRTGGGALF
jgi:hypothetical protein